MKVINSKGFTQLPILLVAILILATGTFYFTRNSISHKQESQTAATGGFKLPPEGISFEDVEKNLILQAMDQTDYNITKSAKLLGLTFRTLQYRLEKFGIKKPEGKDGGKEEDEE